MVKKLLHIVGVMAIILGFFAIATPQHTARANDTTSVYTIRWFDTQGHIIKVWSGNRTQADKIRRAEDAIRIAALQKRRLLTTFGQVPENSDQHSKGIQPYINRVNDCLYPNSYLVFWNNGPLVCFANNGSQNTAIYNVYRADSGNNSGGYTAVCHLYGGYQTFHHYETDYPPPNDPWEILYVNITGR